MNYEECMKAVEYIKSKGVPTPKIAFIYGTGLGKEDSIPVDFEIKYSDIPGFPVATTKGNENKLVFGKIAGVPYVAQKGRFHYYEGYSPKEIVSGVRVMKLLGADTLMLSNAAGGINPQLKVGDLMLISDHINLLENPLLGRNDRRFGERFPDMTHTYSRDIRNTAKKIAEKNTILLKEGVYIANPGPSFETPAEYKFYGMIGADAVGMSTTQEVIAAKHLKMEVFAVSVITNEAYGFKDDFQNSELDVIEVANKSADTLNQLFIKIVEELYS
jgi:purine-nucleoside phosphorylase